MAARIGERYTFLAQAGVEEKVELARVKSQASAPKREVPEARNRLAAVAGDPAVAPARSPPRLGEYAGAGWLFVQP